MRPIKVIGRRSIKPIPEWNDRYRAGYLAALEDVIDVLKSEKITVPERINAQFDRVYTAHQRRAEIIQAEREAWDQHEI